MSATARDDEDRPGADVVVLAGAEEVERIIAPIVLGFASDPFVRWFLSDTTTFLTYFPQLTRTHADSTVEAGGVYRLGDFRGAAIWYPPGVPPNAEALGAIFGQAVGEGTGARVTSILARAAEHEPPEPHWYLRVIGLDPRLAGKGHGSRLMEAHLELLDRNGEFAYLEATSARSRDFYERHGFETAAEIASPDAPSLWPMLRSPQPSP